jgi:hypothetical protein
MDISTHHSKVLEKELTNELKDEVNVNDITMDNEGIYVNVTLRGKLYNLVKENLLYFHTKLTKWMSCTTNTVEKIYEPVGIEKLKVVEVDEPVVTEDPVSSEEKLENIKEPFEEHIKEPLEFEIPLAVVVEKPIPIEERI